MVMNRDGINQNKDSKMKKYLYTIITLFAAFLTSCSIQESETTTIKTNAEEPEFYASIEEASTRVFVDENLSVLWNADDRVSIFNKNTYNQQYKFLGETGDNAGGFNKVDVAEFVTGKPITNVISVYPYQEDTKISEDGVLTVTLPAEQAYSENTFGMGTNMMVSVSSDNYLQYKNVGGYLRLKLYGEGVTISSIILTGNNGEKLVGKANITLSSDGIPSVQMSNDANTGVSLNCNRSVLLGSSSEKSTEFWFVLPPVTFSKGFTITVKKKNGQTFTKKTSNPVTITRNNLLNMVPFEVEMEGTQPNNVIYYTSKDSTIVEPSTVRGFGASYVSNNYIDGIGILTFAGDVTDIPSYAFENCSTLTSISLPETLTSIRYRAFANCSGLTGSLTIPDRVNYIESDAFSHCSGLTEIVFPESLTSIPKNACNSCSGLTKVSFSESLISINEGAFMNCFKMTDLIIPEGVTSIKKNAFNNCKALKSFDIPTTISSIEESVFQGCDSLYSITLPNSITAIGNLSFAYCANLRTISIPGNVTTIGKQAFLKCSNLSSINLAEGLTNIGVSSFADCTNLTSVIIPQTVSKIGSSAFNGCSNLSLITMRSQVPPVGGSDMFANTGLCPIYIPAGSKDLYLNADYWKHYALRMMEEGSSESIAYCSTDYSKDGEVVQLQQASAGRGINIVFLGDGFLDRDMAPGGKYEQKMQKAMEKFFDYEPYTSFRNRFNVYAVIVVSKNDLFDNEASDRSLSYDENDRMYFRLDRCYQYAHSITNLYDQPFKIAVLFNTAQSFGRSFCALSPDGNACCFIENNNKGIINHELGGHAFGLLMDEYVENADTYSDTNGMDNRYKNFGWGANVDWRRDPNEVRWAHFLKDPRYAYEGLGVYEGGYLYAHGVYRATVNSMMRYNDTPFNAPSREQIYKMIMKYSEGEDWVYDYEEFVKADERGRMEAAEELGPWKSPRRKTRSQIQAESQHHPPVLIDDSVKEVGMDKDGNVILVR